MKRSEAKQKIAEEFNLELEEDLSNFIYLDEKGKEKVSITAVVSHLINKFKFKTLFETKGEKIYVYEEGIYKLKGKETIKTNTEELLQSKCTNNIVSEILEKIKRKTAIDKNTFEKSPEELICLENGILNIRENKIQELVTRWHYLEISKSDVNGAIAYMFLELKAS